MVRDWVRGRDLYRGRDWLGIGIGLGVGIKPVASPWPQTLLGRKPSQSLHRRDFFILFHHFYWCK